MPHFSLRTRLWAQRLLLAVAVCASIYALCKAGMQLATHQSFGLAPDPVSYAKLTESKPSLSLLKVILVPPSDHWDIGEKQSLKLTLENDGNEAAWFDSTLSASGACFLPVSGTSVPILLVPHHTHLLEVPLAPDKCESARLPQQLLLNLRYTWTLQRVRGPGRRSAQAPSQKENLQLPSNAADNSSPLTLNLSIHLPGDTPDRHGVPSKPERSFTGQITLSSIEVTSQDEKEWRRFVQMLSAAAKDFTWPVFLAILGYLAQNLLARRSERQQIFNTMLPTLTKLILEHYVHMARRMQTVDLEAKLIKGPSVSAAVNHPLRRTFGAILLMRRRVQHLFNSNGGIFFRSAVGEELFDTCLSGFYKRFQLTTGDPDECEALALSLRPQAMPHQAYKRIFSPGWSARVDPLYNRFEAWAVDAAGNKVAKFDSYLIQLALAEAVLTFECNRIYYQTQSNGEASSENWYFDTPAFYFDKDIKGIPAEGAERIWTLYRNYLNNMPTECKAGAKYPPHR